MCFLSSLYPSGASSRTVRLRLRPRVVTHLRLRGSRPTFQGATEGKRLRGPGPGSVAQDSRPPLGSRGGAQGEGPSCAARGAAWTRGAPPEQGGGEPPLRGRALLSAPAKGAPSPPSGPQRPCGGRAVCGARVDPGSGAVAVGVEGGVGGEGGGSVLGEPAEASGRRPSYLLGARAGRGRVRRRDLVPSPLTARDGPRRRRRWRRASARALRRGVGPAVVDDSYA